MNIILAFLFATQVAIPDMPAAKRVEEDKTYQVLRACESDRLVFQTHNCNASP